MSFDPESFPVPDLGLRCFNCHYQLTGLMVHRCPECGRPFTMDEHIPSGDFPNVLIDGQPVFATPELLALLKEWQIFNLPLTDMTSSLYGFSREISGMPRLSVARGVYWDAVNLITRYRRGEPIDPPPSAGDVEWSCKACGESNPGNFEFCWQCNGDRSGAAG